MSMLTQAAIFLTAAVLAVPLFIKLRLGAVLGYLVAGLVIGPYGFGWISNADDILNFSKVGVVMLLFVIGLEIEPTQLWRLRRRIFSLGPLQLVVCGVPIGVALWWTGMTWPATVVIATALAFSSTAIPMQALQERGELKSAHGRAVFSLTMFKYLALLPILGAIPLMGPEAAAMEPASLGRAAALQIVALAVIVLGGHFLLRPVLRQMARVDGGDTFTAMALLVVVGTAVLVDAVGLPMPLGAFLAGVLLAESEYRHEIHTRVDPFKGVLLGLFFIAVGMTADLSLILEQPGLVLGLAVALLLLKLAGMHIVGRVTGLPSATAARMAGFVPQAGEMAFVLFATALTHDVLDQGLADLLIVVTTLSMVATPMLLVIMERWVAPLLEARDETPRVDEEGGAETEPSVIIIGFGRFGQLVGRLLHSAGIQFTALDADPLQVDFLRRYGHRISFGNAIRSGVLSAAGVGRAQAVVLAINNIDESVRIAESLRRFFPGVPVYALARTRAHAWRLMDQGVAHTVRTALAPSVELGKVLLHDSGGWAWDDAERLAEDFQLRDETYMLDQYTVHRWEDSVSPTADEVEQELADLFKVIGPGLRQR